MIEVEGNNQGGTILTKRGIITAAQARTMSTIPFQILPVPGSGKFYIINSISFRFPSIIQAFSQNWYVQSQALIGLGTAYAINEIYMPAYGDAHQLINSTTSPTSVGGQFYPNANLNDKIFIIALIDDPTANIGGDGYYYIQYSILNV